MLVAVGVCSVPFRLEISVQVKVYGALKSGERDGQELSQNWETKRPAANIFGCITAKDDAEDKK